MFCFVLEYRYKLWRCLYRLKVAGRNGKKESEKRFRGFQERRNFYSSVTFAETNRRRSYHRLGDELVLFHQRIPPPVFLWILTSIYLLDCFFLCCVVFLVQEHNVELSAASVWSGQRDPLNRSPFASENSLEKIFSTFGRYFATRYQLAARFHNHKLQTTSSELFVTEIERQYVVPNGTAHFSTHSCFLPSQSFAILQYRYLQRYTLN